MKTVSVSCFFQYAEYTDSNEAFAEV